MGKLLCDSTTIAETFQTSSPTASWREPNSVTLEAVDLVDQTITSTTEAATWEDVIGLEVQQRRNLTKLHAKGVLWKHPNEQDSSVVFRLSHGGDVSADGNCLFTASQRAMGREVDAGELRRRTVKRFLEDLRSANEEEMQMINDAIRNMYSPDMRNGWGVHVVQEFKLLAKKEERVALDSAIEELVKLGMRSYFSCSWIFLSELVAESIYKERCVPVNDGSSWAKYMSISGSTDDEYDIITLQYTEDGLLSVDENREGHAAAFGDDIAIECLATEFNREIYVVQAHGSDALVDEDNCIFFLPHRPRSEICEPPFFLFMKGTGWCGAGADHYEPLIAQASSLVSPEKVALVL
ncbi:hypothetical protein REPUB_Repub01dG0117200 [Reevesia pubescens]